MNALKLTNEITISNEINCVLYTLYFKSNAFCVTDFIGWLVGSCTILNSLYAILNANKLASLHSVQWGTSTKRKNNHLLGDFSKWPVEQYYSSSLKLQIRTICCVTKLEIRNNGWHCGTMLYWNNFVKIETCTLTRTRSY